MPAVPEPHRKTRASKSDARMTRKEKRVFDKGESLLYSPNKKSKSKKKRPPPIPDEVPAFEAIMADGYTIDEIISKSPITIPSIAKEALFKIRTNGQTNVLSLAWVLSQHLYGNSSQSESIRDIISLRVPKKKPSKLKNNFDSKEYLVAVAELYKDIRFILFREQISTTEYDISYYGKDKTKENNIIFIHEGYESRKDSGLELMIPKLKRNIPVSNGDKDECDTNDPNQEFEIESIVSHSNSPEFRYYSKTKFLVKWKSYPDKCNTLEPWNTVLHTNPLQKYIKILYKKFPENKHLARAQKAIDAYLVKNVVRNTRSGIGRNSPFPERDLTPRSAEKQKPVKRKPPKLTMKRNKKNKTGKKITFIGEEDLEGKGGVYAFLPFDDLDAKEKGIFKLGMTTNFKRREEQFHSYFPEGVYFINFLAEPDIPEWNAAKIAQWVEQYNTGKPANKQKKQPSKEDMQSDFYKKVESYIFKYVETHKGTRIYSNTRVKNVNAEKQGATEWFYTTEDVIHDAFQSAHEHFKGGTLKTYYLEGLNPETGEMVASIHDMAKARMQQVPNYTGKIIYRI